jgi:arginine exporter protein ArgO
MKSKFLAIIWLMFVFIIIVGVIVVDMLYRDAMVIQAIGVVIGVAFFIYITAWALDKVFGE